MFFSQGAEQKVAGAAGGCFHVPGGTFQDMALPQKEETGEDGTKEPSRIASADAERAG